MTEPRDPMVEDPRGPQEQTVLDRAHHEMQAQPDDEAARLRYFERLADNTLFILLREEAQDDRLSPELFDLGDARFVLVFDREDRLSGFIGQAAPYAALSGRAIAQMLKGQEVGLAVNLGVEATQNLVPPEAVHWLSQTLDHAPEEINQGIAEISAPRGLPEVLLTALDSKLASARGFARSAYLVAAEYRDGTRGHMLGFVDAQAGAEPPLAQAVQEALVFSGIEMGRLDVGFFAATEALAAVLAQHGLRFDLPQLEVQESPKRPAPGSDPNKPPKLR